MAIPHVRKALLVALGTALAVSATTFGVAQAVTGGVTAAAAAEDMPSAVEDFGYPNAAQIQADTGGLLKRGDGNILLKACDGSQDLTVYTRAGQKDFCFDVKAKPAYLSLELPQAYGIWTSSDPVKTTLKEADGSTVVINAPANDFTGYGESGSAEGEATVLVELRIAG
ncbi:hypothetical protein [Streptomyces sp. NPDC001744]|uniref:hypothetical protein n=1 Tax=Streptomyces sp. NPDC001744 TaxID=3364606 RepID=UPI0036A46CED